MSGFSGRTLRNLARRSIDTTFEARIAQTTMPAVSNFQSLPFIGQIADQFAGIDIVDHSTAGYIYVQIFARFPGLVSPGSGLAAFGAKSPLHPEIDQRVDRLVGNHEYIAAMSTIAAIRTALGNKLLPQKTQAAVTAVAGLDSNSCFIDEFHRANTKKGQSFASSDPFNLKLSDRLVSDNAHKLTVLRAFFLKLHVAVTFCV